MGRAIDLVYIAAWLVVIAGLSVYKLVMIYRSRNDPAKYRWYLNQSAVLPEKIMRRTEDSSFDNKHPESSPSTPARKRSAWLL